MKPFFILLGSLCGLLVLGASCFVTKQSDTVLHQTPTHVTAPSFDWARVSTASVTASNDVVVKSCGGDGPIVCAYKDNKPIGQMQFLTYEKGNEKMTVDARIADYYKNISEDRKAGCPSDYTIETSSVQMVTVGGFPGKRAVLEVFNTQKKPVERIILYMTEQETHLVVFNIAGYAEGSCLSPDVDYATISGLDSGAEDAFAAVVETSKISF